MTRQGRVNAGLLAVGAVIVLLTVAIATSGRSSDRLPAGPVAAVQDDQLPTRDTPAEIRRRMAMVAATGASATRIDLFWSDLAPTAPSDPANPDDRAYDWTRADAAMRAAADHGLSVILSLYSTPTWATADPDDPGPENPASPVRPGIPRAEAYAAVMEALARRYSGEYRSPGATLPLPQVRRLELWNEPNLDRFLAPQTDAQGRRLALDGYARMVRAAYPRIKAANPEAIVIVGAVGPTGSTSATRTGADRWLEGMRRQRVPMDAWSQHIYPAAPPAVPTGAFPSWSSIGRLLAMLDRIDPNLPLYITEAGYTTAETAARGPYARVATEAEQAEFLRTIYALPQLQTQRIPTVVWFNLQDNADWPSGLLRDDESPKPSHEAFRAVADRQRSEGVTLD